MHFALDGRLPRLRRTLRNGKRIHIAAQTDRTSRPQIAVNHADDPRYADVFSHFNTPGAKLLRHDPGRSRFFKTELGMHMEIMPPIGKLFTLSFERLQNLVHG